MSLCIYYITGKDKINENGDVMMLKKLFLRVLNRKNEAPKKIYVPKPVIHYVQPELPFGE